MAYKLTLISKQTIALAAMFQAAELIYTLANTGCTDEQGHEVLLQSIMKQGLKTPFVEIYHPLKHLQLGLKKLVDTFCTDQASRTHKFSLLISFWRIARSFRYQKSFYRQMHKRLLKIQQQIEYFGFNHPQVINQLEKFYLDCLKKTQIKLQIRGRKSFLQNPGNLTQIRLLLLAGVRAALLWYQMEGKLWTLLTQRRLIQQEARRLLSILQHNFY